MKKRIDHQTIKAITHRYGSNRANAMQNLPFFHITKEIENQFTHPFMLNREGQQRQLSEYIVNCGMNNLEEIEELLYFHKFAVWIDEIGYFQISLDVQNKLWRIANVLDEHTSRIVQTTSGTVSSALEGYILEQILKIPTRPTQKEKGTEISIAFSYLPANNKTNKYIDNVINDINKKDPLKHQQAMASIQILEFILSYFKWAASNNKFLIRQQPPTTKQDIKSAKNKPWLRTDTTHYIYLNQLPTNHPKSSNKRGDSSPKRGHNRRAHWRHFTSDKFKHAKGKRIRIKESWVGPTETTYHGSTYTVLLEGEKDDY